METIRIEPGSRFWPAGFAALGASAPVTLTVRGNRQNLTQQAVVVDGTALAHPRGMSDCAKITAEIAKTDIAIAGNVENPMARAAVVSAVSAGGAGVLFTRHPLNQDWSEEREIEEAIERVLQDGGTVASLAPDEQHELDERSFARNLAAYSTVTLVPEAIASYEATALAEAALELGRRVAVITPPGARGWEYAGSRELLQNPRATSVQTGRDVIGLVDPPLESSTDVLLRQLDHLEFSERVTQLRNANWIHADTVKDLFEMAHESADMKEFQARMHYAGPRMMGATEYRFLMTTLETPEGQTPATWEESAAYVRAFGIDRYQGTCRVQAVERNREMHVASALQMG